MSISYDLSQAHFKDIHIFINQANLAWDGIVLSDVVPGSGIDVLASLAPQ